jgi:fibronectin type 3 domain-containing protein
VNGDDLAEIYSFDVYRAAVPIEDLCENCPIPFSEPTEIPGGETAESGKRKIGVYNTTLLRPDHKYFYKMTARISWWAASTDSNIVSFVWKVPPSVPAGFTVQGGDSKIMLSWQPVTTLIDGSAIDQQVLYQVSRSEGGKEFRPIGEPLAATRFTDADVVNGKTYFYKVQSLMMLGKDRVSGGITEIVDGSPVDMTPPDVPTGVRATATSAGNKIYWDRPSDLSVAGHRVYRRVRGQGPAEQIGEVAMPSSIFVDESVPENGMVYYFVTAIDSAEPANESKASREATVR